MMSSRNERSLEWDALVRVPTKAGTGVGGKCGRRFDNLSEGGLMAQGLRVISSVLVALKSHFMLMIPFPSPALRLQ